MTAVARVAPDTTAALEAERALLGGLLVEPERIADLGELAPGDFELAYHGELFALLLDMQQASSPIDIVTVGGRVARAPGRYNGAAYVASLPEHCPSTPAVPYYAEQVAARAVRRRLLEQLDRARADAADERSDPSEIVARLTSIPIHPRSPNKRTPMEAIVTRPVEWCWRDRIPFGGITIIEGDPGLGKTTLALDLLARASRGALEVGPGGSTEPVVSLVLSREDSPEYTLRPRLEVARADLSRIIIPHDIDTFPADVGALEAHIAETGARLVFIDPLVAYLGVDTHKDSDVRRALSPLNELSMRLKVAIVAIRHLTKGGDRPAMYRGGGSIAFTGAARAVHVVGKDPEQEGRLVLAPVKTNLGRRPQSLAWKLIPPLDPGGVCGVEHLGPCELTADELVATGGPVTREEGAKLTEAVEWLAGVLGDGPLSPREIKDRAAEDGLSWATIRRAQARLGVKPRQGPDGWVWLLTPGGMMSNLSNRAEASMKTAS